MPKVLLFDIETTPILVYTWGVYEQNILKVVEDPYILCFAYKWLDEPKTYTVSLRDYPRYKRNKKDDKQLVLKLHELLNEADYVVGQNCVSIDTMILKQDLTWVRAGNLKKGDKIVGFEEGFVPNRTLRDKAGKWRGIEGSVRRIKPTTVTDISVKLKDCYEVELSNGDRVVTTPDHYWLGKTKKDNFYKWLRTEDLKPGYRFTKFWNVWDIDKSYEAGWLSGFIAGEGTLKQSGVSFGVDFFQRPGSTWEQALNYCKKLNMPVSSHRTKRPTGIGRQDVLCTGFIGGKYKIAENIGRLQIKRFIEKIDWDKFGGLKGHRLKTVRVVSVKPIGKRKVAVMSTSKKTFFADGYAMHNCDRFDLRWANKQFVKHRLEPVSPFESIDTLKIARRHFRFDSNHLDDLGRFLGVGRKVKHEGIDLWFNVMEGDRKAWNKMLKYVKQDVQLLEKVYKKLRPYAMNIINKEDGVCTRCGSYDIILRGTRTLKSGMQYQRYKCKDCGGWLRGRIGERASTPLQPL